MADGSKGFSEAHEHDWSAFVDRDRGRWVCNGSAEESKENKTPSGEDGDLHSDNELR